MTAKRIYFFSGTQYSRFDDKISRVPGQYPAEIARWWSGLPAGPIDAVVNWGDNRVYFFVGANYYRWNMLLNRVDAGYPKPITGNWSGFAGTGFENGFDDAVNWGNGKVYFFKDDKYLRMDWARSTVDPNYPKAISAGWPALAAKGFGSGIDAVINRGNGKAYFFKGANYLRYDIAADAVDAGYPKAIAGNWPGVFAGGVSAAVEWPYALVGPGGFRVPTNFTACQVVGAGGGRNKAGRTWDMEIDFIDTPYPASLPVGEYRQYIRGTFTVNGTNVLHGLPPASGSPAGSPPRNMQPAPGANPASDNFLEDGLTAPPASQNVYYGHRIDTAGNSDTTDQFLPDRIPGAQYRGNDFPGLTSVPGTVYAMALDFRGQSVDRATSDEVLDTAEWSVNCAGTL